MEHKIILPASFYSTQDAPDSSFVKRMQSIDAKLTVYWNKFRGRWVIDRFTCASDHRDHVACPRINVKLVQTEDGTYHPLNDRVLDWLREADMWNRGLKPDEVNNALDAKRDAYERSREDDMRHLVREVIHDDHIHQESNLTPN